jgi:hypothetical protein
MKTGLLTKISKAEAEAMRRERRERIATAVLQGMATADRTLWDEHGPVLDAGHVQRAVRWADALIVELDRQGGFE